jgi:hypothetical protein
MFMVAVVMVMGLTGHMVTTHVVNHSTVVDKQHHTYKETMHTGINLMLRGVVVVMAQEKVIGVREDVKASLLYMNSTDKY